MTGCRSDVVDDLRLGLKGSNDEYSWMGQSFYAFAVFIENIIYANLLYAVYYHFMTIELCSVYYNDNCVA